MMMDIENLFSDQQSLVASAGAILSDHSIELGAPDVIPGFTTQTPVHDIGRGKEVNVLVQVTQDFDSASDNVTCKAALVMADDEALTSNLTVLEETPAIAQAVLVKGYQWRLGGTIPPGISKRFLGIRYTTAVGDATAGKVTAGLLLDRQSTSV